MKPNTPWLTDLTSTVLGIQGVAPVEDILLNLPLNKVFTMVDLPRPVAPGKHNKGVFWFYVLHNFELGNNFCNFCEEKYFLYMSSKKRWQEFFFMYQTNAKCIIHWPDLVKHFVFIYSSHTGTKFSWWKVELKVSKIKPQMVKTKLTNNHEVKFKSSFERFFADLLLHCIKSNITF